MRPPNLEDAVCAALIRVFGQPSDTERQAVFLAKLNTKLDTIMSTAEESEKQLGEIKDQLVKANTEIQAKIQALVDAAAASGNNTPAGVQAAIEALKPAAQSLDDVVPDQPVA